MEILELETFTQGAITEIITSALEESINIEFKSAASLSKEQSVKKELSKDVSAFANSDGGLIFYGINEENHIATSLSFIDGNVYTKEWLENVIISNIQPKIDHLKIYPIRFEQEFRKSIYAIKIPRSSLAPHINADKKYYRRFNFQSVPMEEYEIRNLYLKQRESKVYLESIVTKLISTDELNENEYSFYVELQVVNDGLYVSEKYKVACDFKNAHGCTFSYDRAKNYSITNKIKGGAKISNNEIVPLFPNEVFNALSFNIAIPKIKFPEIIKNLKCTVLIFNVTGVEEDEIEFGEMLEDTKTKHHD